MGERKREREEKGEKRERKRELVFLLLTSIIILYKYDRKLFLPRQLKDIEI